MTEETRSNDTKEQGEDEAARGRRAGWEEIERDSFMDHK